MSVTLTPQQRRFIKSVDNIGEKDAQETGDMGFICRSMAVASIPHSKVSGTQYKREVNKFKLTISTVNDYSLPYGSYPRLILTWIASEVVKKKEQEITLGRSLSDFMKKVGIAPTGGKSGTMERFKQQLISLFASNITYTYGDPKDKDFYIAHINVVKEAYFWKPQTKQPFNTKFILGDHFYNEILKAPVPVDMRAVLALKDSSLALDIYFWLTYRLSYAMREVHIPYDSLHLQFGSGYKNTPHGRYEFKRKFLMQLKKVLHIYPEARIDAEKDELILYPSRGHVKRVAKFCA